MGRGCPGAMRRWLVAFLVGLGWWAAPSSAQTLEGDFIAGGFNVGGVAVVPSGGSTFIDVDDDGDLLTAPVRYNLSALRPELVGKDQYSLTPSRTVLYVLEDNTGGTGQPSRAWFAELDGQGTGITILQGPVDVSGTAPGSRILNGPFYYDAPGGQQIAGLVIGTTDGQAELFTLLIDLRTPGIDGRRRVELRTGWQPVSRPFSRAGDFFVVKSDVNDADLDGRVDFVIVPLCGDDFGLDAVIEVDRSLIPPDPTFATASVMSGMVDVVARLGTTELARIGFIDCFAGRPPVLGACCGEFFGTLLCNDGVTRGECPDGFAFSPEQTCAQVCPLPALAVSVTAPSAVEAPGVFDYTVTITSTGEATAEDITLRLDLPTQVTFRSATGGGTLSGGRVSWANLGDLAPGNSLTRRVTVEVECTDAGSTAVLDQFGVLARATGSAPARPSSDISTRIDAARTEPVDVSVVSTPDRVPLLEGDEVVHRITFTNTAATPRTISMQQISAGRASEVAGLIDAGGGTFTTVGVTALSWQGPLGPLASVTIEFTTIVSCVSGGSGSLIDYQLNSGSPVRVRNECGQEVGSGSPPAATPILPPLTGSIEAVNVQPGLIGPPASSDGTFEAAQRLQLIRDGATLEFELEFRNQQPTDLARVTMSAVMPDELSVDNPPFVGTPGPGFSWDAATRTIAFAGPLPAGSSAGVRFAGVFTANGACTGTTLSARLGTGGSCTAAAPAVTLWVIPVPPANDVLYALDPFRNGIAAYEIVGDEPVNTERFFCTSPEIFYDFAVSRGGTLYLTGLPSYELDPATLELRVLDAPGFYDDVANPFFVPELVAADPTSDRVFLTARPGDGPDSFVALAPGGAPQTASLDETANRFEGDPVVDGNGDLHFLDLAGPGLVRLPTSSGLPVTPGAGVEVPVPPGLDYPELASLGAIVSQSWRRIDNGADGSIAGIVTTQLAPTGSATVVDALVRLEADGTTSVVDPYLGGFQQAGAPPLPAGVTIAVPDSSLGLDTRLAQAPSGVYYLDSFYTGVVKYDPATRVITSVPGIGQEAGIAYRPGPSCPPDLNGDGLLDIFDIIAFFDRFGSGDTRADLTGDGSLDIFDIIAFFDLFGAGC